MALLSDLVAVVRQRTDNVGNLAITDAELTSYLNSSLAELYGLITTSFEDYFVTTYSFALTSSSTGLDLTTLTPEFFKELRIDKSLSGSATAGDWFRIARVNIRDEAAFNQSYLGTLAAPRLAGYVICGSQIRFIPQNNIAGSYRLLYYPAWTDLTLSSTVPAMGPAGMHWEELAILDVCIKVLLKEDRDPSGFMAQKTYLKARIEQEAANRSAGAAEPPPVIGRPWYERGGFGGGYGEEWS